MPTQLYNRELILTACRSAFAQRGYDATSTAMLAEAAKVSKALIFHHFGSKQELYLTVLGDCLREARSQLSLESLPEQADFYRSIVEFGRKKLRFFRDNPDMYQLITQAIEAPPLEVKAEIEARYPALYELTGRGWRRLFEQVSLRPEVDREDAFQLITLIIDHFSRSFIAEVADISASSPNYEQHYLQKLTTSLGMLRFGIEAPKEEAK